jgi:hypothetical protein
MQFFKIKVAGACSKLNVSRVPIRPKTYLENEMKPSVMSDEFLNFVEYSK